MNRSLKLPPSGASTSSKGGGVGGGSGGGVGSDEVNKLQQDLVLLTQKIADMTGEPQRAPPTPNLEGPAGAPSSPFVSGLRGMADSTGGSGGNTDALRLAMTEKVLKKVMELDRALLKKTAPDTEGGSTTQRARRGSRGMDLFTLPTHLHITDRLLDLHTQSKRVVTVTKEKLGNAGSATPAGAGTDTVAPESGGSSSSKEPRGLSPTPPSSNSSSSNSPRPNGAEIKKYKDEVAALKAKLTESEARRATIKDDCQQARKDNLMYKKQLEEANKRNEALQKLAEQEKEKGQSASSSGNDYLARIAELEAQLKTVNAELRSTQERLEEEIARSARTVEAISQRASSVKNNNAEYGNSPQKESAQVIAAAAQSAGKAAALLGDDMSTALERLDEALRHRLAGINDQLLSMSIVKDSLEIDIETMTTSADMVNKDFLQVQQELQAMKGAYSALQSENLGGEGAEKLQRANNLLVDLQAEVAAATRRTMELERLPPALAEQESVNRDLQARIMVLTNDAVVVNEEMNSYKKMTETLKQKIRDLSAKQGNSEKDFLDSFEEVMQDEMYTMKQAFEAKLKAKTEEASAMSNRHQQEINRIQASASPYSASLLRR